MSEAICGLAIQEIRVDTVATRIPIYVGAVSR
jgi:hypothetical protein